MLIQPHMLWYRCITEVSAFFSVQLPTSHIKYTFLQVLAWKQPRTLLFIRIYSYINLFLFISGNMILGTEQLLP